jgi:leucyl aminopeptidase (aminopeptidase T)
VLGNEVSHQRDVLLGRQLDRQRDGHILGELGIGPLLETSTLFQNASEAPRPIDRQS